MPCRSAGLQARIHERTWRSALHSISSDLHHGELAGLDLLVAELAVEDVALVVEVAGARSTGVIDFLARRDRLDAVDGVVDGLAAALRHLADVVLDRRAACVLGERHA